MIFGDSPMDYKKPVSARKRNLRERHVRKPIVIHRAVLENEFEVLFDGAFLGRPTKRDIIRAVPKEIDSLEERNHVLRLLRSAGKIKCNEQGFHAQFIRPIDKTSGCVVELTVSRENIHLCKRK